MITLSCNSISKSFNGKQVLSSLSFSVNRGELVALIGKNSSGKSTICNIISQLVSQDSGVLQINNEEIVSVNQLKPHKLGFLLCQDYLISEFNAKEYLFSLGRLSNYRKDYLHNRIGKLLEHLRFDEPNTLIGNLSTGKKMLVKIAYMLLGDPKILIIDEPFANLDLEYRKIIQDLLLSLKNEGKTILLVTHFPEHIFNMANRVLILEDGNIQSELIVSNYESYDVFLNSILNYIVYPDEE
jgi:ABC-type multidrug transport system ATPase subunit